MSVIQIAHNAVKAKLIDVPREVKLKVSELLSYRVEGAEHVATTKSVGWNGRSSFFHFKQGTFPAGFVHRIHDGLTRAGYTVKIVRKALPLPLGDKNPKVDDFPEDPRYDYQALTVKRLLKHGQIIAQVATGGGKSRIAKLVYATIKRETLFLTTRSVLMHQMKDAFEKDMKIKVGVIGEGEWNATKGMNVAMVQTIAPYVDKKTVEGEIERFLIAQFNAEKKAIDALKLKLKKDKATLREINTEIARLRRALIAKRPSDSRLATATKAKVAKHNAKHLQVLKFLERFEVVILEEAHEAGGNGFFEILKRCVNAHYRLSLTATPFMRDDEEANMRLMATSGPIGIKISEDMLIKRGILAKPIFKIVDMGDPIKKLHPNYNKVRRTTPWQRAYKLGIAENEVRNEIIVEECARSKRNGLTAMVLVHHTAHGHILKKMMLAEGIKADFIYGKHEQSQRKRALARLSSGEIDVLIGSTILDVGVDVPAVGLVILAGGGKAEVALRQRIGRGLRCKKSGPNICLVVDFSDLRNSHLKGHAMQRRAIIEDTPGFAENILPKGVDFDYEELGLAA
ncbi:MAG: DEAD/DEAH box helicase [Piscirickettsiaceae bacterium]|nr:DEAD/DEAH box helicase [Piscirickettsiaceae bacterium]